ncbi:MAG: hypothetical protein GOV00_04605, partial [Candidatus Altiarchaeota archaeon]|nr:hypothetical protein [Candidatus Altiarchaeota archaeon]
YPRYKNDLDFGQPIMLHWKIMGKRIFPGNFRMKEKPLTEKQFKRFKAELEKEFAK